MNAITIWAGFPSMYFTEPQLKLSNFAEYDLIELLELIFTKFSQKEIISKGNNIKF